MPRHPRSQFAKLLFATAIVAGAGASAAELGDAKVNSYIGQQLSADIELTSLHDAAGTVQARVASLDVYRGAGLEMPSVMSSVNLGVVRRDGKQFLHVTSTRPIEADHLHVYLELTDGGQRAVRLVTLWFAPDPTPPAPPVRLAAAPVPAPPVVQEIAPARRGAPHALPPAHQKPVRPLEPAPAPAKEPAHRLALTDEARPLVATVEAKPLHPGASRATFESGAAEPKPAKPVAAQSEPKTAMPVAAAALETKPGPKPVPLAASIESKDAKHAAAAETRPAKVVEQPKPAASPNEPKPPPLAWAAAKAKQPPPAAIALPRPAPACPKEPSQTESACTGLDGKNAELRAELVKLEARVKILQEQEKARAAKAAEAAAAPKPAPQPDPPAMPSTSKSPGHAVERPAADEKFGQVLEDPPAPAPAFKPVKLKPVVPTPPPPPKPEDVGEGMPWGWIAGAGAAVFALIGALQFWRHRRKQGKKVQKVHQPLPETDDEEQIEPTFG